jgi:hypothetical protein
VTESSKMKVAIVLVTNVQYALTTYRPIVESLRQEQEIEALAISVGKKPLTDTDFEDLKEVCEVTFPNPFNNEWRQDRGQGALRKFKLFQLIRLGLTLYKTKHAFTKFLLEHKPDVIVLQIDRQSPVTDLIKVANKFGIPTLLLQGAMVSKNLSYREKLSTYNRVAKWLLGFASGYHLEGQGGVDRTGAWGESGAQYYEKVGIPQSNIDIVGSPRLDMYVTELAKSNRANTLRTLGFTPDQNYVLFATSPLYSIANPGENVATVRLVIETAIKIADQDSNFRLVLKPHPTEMEPFERSGILDLCRSSSAITLAQGVSIADALAACDRAIVFYSTVALEAALAGKPCIAFNPYNWDFGNEYSQMGMVSELKSVQELTDYMLAKPDSLPPGDPTYFMTNIGNAADSISNVIRKMANSTKPADL